MTYKVNDNNWDSLFSEYSNKYPSMTKLFYWKQLPEIFIDKIVSQEESEKGSKEFRQVYERPITPEHFDRVNAIGCWLKKANYSYLRGNELGRTLFLSATGPTLLDMILQEDILKNQAIDASLLKLSILELIKDNYYYPESYKSTILSIKRYSNKKVIRDLSTEILY